jgi:hypothetical protein
VRFSGHFQVFTYPVFRLREFPDTHRLWRVKIKTVSVDLAAKIGVDLRIALLEDGVSPGGSGTFSHKQFTFFLHVSFLAHLREDVVLRHDATVLMFLY